MGAVPIYFWCGAISHLYLGLAPALSSLSPQHGAQGECAAWRKGCSSVTLATRGSRSGGGHAESAAAEKASDAAGCVELPLRSCSI
jgi:hypothetical protein